MEHRRGRRYSNDLRLRVLAAIDAGGKAYDLAPISVSYIYKALDRRRRTGLSTVSEKRGHAPRKLTANQEDALRAYILANDSATLEHMRGWLMAEHGVQLSTGGIWNVVDRLGITHKKRARSPLNRIDLMWRPDGGTGGLLRVTLIRPGSSSSMRAASIPR